MTKADQRAVHWDSPTVVQTVVYWADHLAAWLAVKWVAWKAA